jgi:N-acetylmuramoyl-L-alanine amidase
MKPGKQLFGLFQVRGNSGVRIPVLAAHVALALLLLFPPPSQLSGETLLKPLAPELYNEAVQLRTALEGKPKRLRTSSDYQKVISKYRSVYHQFPGSSRADDALLAVAELYQLMGSDLKSARNFQQAIQAYVFLEREYPASPYGAEGLFTAAEIYLNDLNDATSAQDLFKDLLNRYPHSKRARNARARLDDLRTQLKQVKKSTSPKVVASSTYDAPTETLSPRVEQRVPDDRSRTVETTLSAKGQDSPKRSGKTSLPEQETREPSVISVIRYWNTEDYTRLVITTDREVKYIEGRLDNPTRVFVDIQNVRLSPALTGKTVVLNDGYVSKIRLGQSNDTVARVVLDMSSFKNCQVLRLSNPSRIVVDVQGGARIEQSKTSSRANAAWRVQHGEPLADEVNLQAALQKNSVAKSTEEKNVAAKFTELAVPTEPIQMKQAVSKKPADTLAKTEIKKVTAGDPPREKEPKSIARSSVPKGDGTRSLIRTLGLKVGRIVIDAGHGGHDTGTVGPSGLQEKDLVLDIALKLKTLVEERLGSEVLLTRVDDTFIPLEERTAMANHSQADLFLSIHANSSRNRRVSGVETFFLDFASSPEAEEIAARENSSAQKTIFELQDLVQKIALKEKIDESRELAQIVQKSVTSQLQKAHSQTRDRGVKQAPFIVLIGANMPSILSEVSFMSNPSDEKLLKSSSYRQKLAEALCRGIEAYAEALGGIKTARNLP